MAMFTVRENYFVAILALSTFTACGFEPKSKKDQSASADAEVLPLDKGSVEFDTASLTAEGGSGAKEPGHPGVDPVPPPKPQPAPGAKLVINYLLDCGNDHGVAAEAVTDSVVAERAADVPTVLYAPDTPVSNDPAQPTPGGFLPPRCFSGSITIDLQATRVAKIAKIPAGFYSFTAILYDANGIIIKRGSAYFEVLGGQITRGKLVLYGVHHGNGGVIIDIVDGDKPVPSHNACIEYKKLSNTVRPLLCEVGEFTCTYEKFVAKTPCDEFSARLSILKQLCEAKVSYNPKLLHCTHTK